MSTSQSVQGPLSKGMIALLAAAGALAIALIVLVVVLVTAPGSAGSGRPAQDTAPQPGATPTAQAGQPATAPSPRPTVEVVDDVATDGQDETVDAAEHGQIVSFEAVAREESNCGAQPADGQLVFWLSWRTVGASDFDVLLSSDASATPSASPATGTDVIGLPCLRDDGTPRESTVFRLEFTDAYGDLIVREVEVASPTV